MEVNSDYVFIRISEEHLPLIASLHRLVFKSAATARVLERTFDTRLFGCYTIGYIALTRSGEVASYYGVFPIIGFHNGKQALIAQSGATMTHPRHQKRGLFVKLAKMTFESAEKEGVKFIYGFPNTNSLPGFQNKLNWKFQGSLRKIVLKTSCLPFCELASRSKLFKHIYRKVVRVRISSFVAQPSTTFFSDSSVVHSKEFLEYKMRDPDVYLVQKDGISFLVKCSPHLLIGCIQVGTEVSPSKLKSALLKLGVMFLASKVVLQFTSSHKLLNELIGNESSPSLPVGYLNLNPVDNEIEGNLLFDYADIDTF